MASGRDENCDFLSHSVYYLFSIPLRSPESKCATETEVMVSS